MIRPSRDTVMLTLAKTIGTRSTCTRRQVGCVLTDKYGRVLAMGHNGVPMSMPHCIENPCPGAKLPSGTGLDLCQSIHAEQNALMFCTDITKIDTCYVTVSTCSHCCKMLLNSSCRRIVFLEEYSHPEAKELWTRAKRKWEKLTLGTSPSSST